MSNDLSDPELARYGRHVMLDEIGIDGQLLLRNAKVAIIGAGGLGCPIASYLASSGVGQITIFDDDIVELSNLQRQLLYTDDDVEKFKVTVAAKRLSAINPHIEIIPKKSRITKENAAEELTGMTLVIDASDNFKTRHLVNNICFAKGIDLVGGSAERFDGQIYSFMFSKNKSPCYNCLYPETNEVPNITPCALLGVFAPLLGIIGSLVVAEVLLLLTKQDKKGLASRMLLYDSLELRMKILGLKQSAACQICK